MATHDDRPEATWIEGLLMSQSGIPAIDDIRPYAKCKDCEMYRHYLLAVEDKDEAVITMLTAEFDRYCENECDEP